MGQAKRRGTLEQRAEQSVARKKREWEEREFYRQEYARYQWWFLSRLTAQQRFQEASRQHGARQAAILLAAYGGLGAIRL